jgi:hypothetical protein
MYVCIYICIYLCIYIYIYIYIDREREREMFEGITDRYVDISELKMQDSSQRPREGHNIFIFDSIIIIISQLQLSCDHFVAVCSTRCICQHMSAYVSIRPIRPHTSAYVSIRQHTSAYVRTCQHAVSTPSVCVLLYLPYIYLLYI